MSRQTMRFGPIEYCEEDVIHFPDGLVGFPHARRFVLLANEEEWPFSWLQSLEITALAFVVVPVTVLFPEHASEVLRDLPEVSAMGEGANFTLLGVVVLNQDPAKMTVNLLAPIFLDLDRRLGKQLVLNGPLELVREPLAPALATLAAA